MAKRLLIFAIMTDHSRTFLTDVPENFDVQSWANQPERIKAMKLLDILRIEVRTV